MNNLTYSQKVGNWLLKQSGCSLQDYCIKFKYYPLAVKIMNLDENDEKKSKMAIARDKELKELYLACNANKTAISRKGNNRSWTQYFKDLICGWIIEDLVVEMLRRQEIEVIRNGRDAQRVIEFDNNVTQEADLQIKVGDVTRKVELSNEFNPYLGKCGFIEKRAPALYKLWKDRGIWIYRDLSRGKYVLVDFGTENIVLHLRHHNTAIKDWSKDVHRYVLAENGKIERDDRLLAPEIISVVGCSIESKEQPKLNEVEDEDSPPQIFTIGGEFRKRDESQKPETEIPKVKAEKQTEVEETPAPKVTEKKKKPKTEPLPPPLESDDALVEETDDEDTADFSEETDFGDSDFV